PLLPVDDVGAVAAEDDVGAVATGDGVRARSAVDDQLGQRGQVAGGGEPVVAAVRVELHGLGGADVEGEGRGRHLVEPDPAAVRRGAEGLGAGAAADLHLVVVGSALVEVRVVPGFQTRRS